MKKLAILISMVGMFVHAWAQDPQFSQYFAAPLYLNPAFAGTDSCARLGVNYRNQWPNIEGQFITYSLAYDMHINPLHSGFGVLVLKDKSGSGTIDNTNISGIYSFQQHIYKELNMSIAIQGAYFKENLDWSKIIGDTIYSGPAGPDPIYPPVKTDGSVFDLTGAMELYTNNFYGGISVAHLTQPIFDFGYYYSTQLAVKYTFNAGAMLPLDNSNSTYLSPNIIIIAQDNFHQTNLGLYIQHKALAGGVNYRWGDAIIATLGIQLWGFKLGYNYDATVSKLANAAGGAHEMSLGYRFHAKPKNEGFQPIVCPSF
ncbi:MAG: PorP/SprF family type IX secretion system membrane protein [Bacteroidota bacterium]